MKPIYSDYSVLPRLEKLDDISDAHLGERDEMYDHFIAEKKQADWNSSQKPVNFCWGFNSNQKLYANVTKKIAQLTGQEVWPISFLGDHIQEDFAVHVIEHDKDYLGFTHISFSSGWCPKEAIGKSFEELHAPVPGFKYNPKILDAMLHSGPFRRYVWSIVYDPWEQQKINYHPSLPKASFDPANPYFHLKIETQTIYGMPDDGAVLFFMRQKLLPFEEIQLDKLAGAVYNMTSDERRYKGITNEFVEYLNV